MIDPRLELYSGSVKHTTFLAVHTRCIKNARQLNQLCPHFSERWRVKTQLTHRSREKGFIFSSIIHGYEFVNFVRGTDLPTSRQICCRAYRAYRAVRWCWRFRRFRHKSLLCLSQPSLFLWLANFVPSSPVLIFHCSIPGFQAALKPSRRVVGRLGPLSFRRW